MSRRAKDTKAKPNVHFSGFFVKYWWLLYCIIRWRMLHVRKKRDFNSREYFCFKDSIENSISLTGLSVKGVAAPQHGLKNGSESLKMISNLSRRNHTAILGLVNFSKKPESNWALVAKPCRKGLGSSSQEICGLKPATEHCDETRGWFEMIKWLTTVHFLCYYTWI